MNSWVAGLSVALVLASGLQAQKPPGSRPTSRPAEDRMFESPADQKAFDALHAQFLEALGALSKLQQKQRQGDTLSDAEQQALELHRKQVKDLSLALAKLLAPPVKEEKLAPAPERPLSPQEEKLRNAADALARATLNQERIPYLGRARAVVYRETILLDHPSLAVLPRFRFYLAKIEISPQAPPARPGKDRIKPPQRFQYQLLSYDLTANSVKHYYGFGHYHVVRPLFLTGRIRVKDRATAQRLPVAMALLSEASRGANIFSPPKGPNGLTRAELDNRFSLGRYAGKIEPYPAHVVETDKQRIVVLYRLSASDWNMPLLLEFELLRFDLVTGRYLGTDKRHHKPTFPADTKLDDTGVRKAIAVLEKNLQSEGRNR